MTLSIPKELHEEMKKHPTIRWSEVARQAIEKKITTLDRIERIAQKSKLTQKDVDEISAIINKRAAERFIRDNRR